VQGVGEHARDREERRPEQCSGRRDAAVLEKEEEVPPYVEAEMKTEAEEDERDDDHGQTEVHRQGGAGPLARAGERPQRGGGGDQQQGVWVYDCDEGGDEQQARVSHHDRRLRVDVHTARESPLDRRRVSVCEQQHHDEDRDAQVPRVLDEARFGRDGGPGPFRQEPQQVREVDDPDDDEPGRHVKRGPHPGGAEAYVAPSATSEGVDGDRGQGDEQGDEQQGERPPRQRPLPAQEDGAAAPGALVARCVDGDDHLLDRASHVGEHLAGDTLQRVVDGVDGIRACAQRDRRQTGGDEGRLAAGARRDGEAQHLRPDSRQHGVHVRRLSRGRRRKQP